MITKKNQVNPPLPKRKRVDSLGNNRKRVFFKSGNSTMLFCKGLTENGAKALENAISDACIKLGTKIEGVFIVTN